MNFVLKDYRYIFYLWIGVVIISKFYNFYDDKN